MDNLYVRTTKLILYNVLNQETHCWVLLTRDISLSHCSSLLHLLSFDEQKKYSLYMDITRRYQYALTHIMKRLILSSYIAIKPENWCFSIGKYGKPEISNESLPLRLVFNISHTQGCSVIVVGTSSMLGVDIESYTRRIPLAVVPYWFTSDEILTINESQKHNNPMIFWRLWTLKESFLKAQGIGIHQTMNGYHFQLINNRWMLYDSAEKAYAIDWNFTNTTVEDKYSISIASNDKSTSQREIRFFDGLSLIPSIKIT